MQSTAKLYSALKLFNDISYSSDFLVHYRKMMDNISVNPNVRLWLLIDPQII